MNGVGEKIYYLRYSQILEDGGSNPKADSLLILFLSIVLCKKIKADV